MLLRVRTPSGTTLKLRVDPTLSYAAVLAQAVAEAGEAGDLALSLNRRDPLPALPATWAPSARSRLAIWS